jgi:hypothetical protein
MRPSALSVGPFTVVVATFSVHEGLLAGEK